MSDPDSSFVVDASVSLAWLFEDEATPFTEAALDRVAQGPVWVPSLWTLECVNVLLSAQRRARISAAKREMLLERAIALPLNVDRTAVAMERIDALAARYGLSAHDAAYLELAIRLSVPLVTLDARLAKAARASGVEVHTAKS